MVTAFSHPDFKKNQARAKHDPCCICGKEIKDASKAKKLRVNFANEFVSPDALLAPGEDIGYFSVGPECLRKHPGLVRLAK